MAICILQITKDSMNILLSYIDNDNDEVVGIMIHLPKYKMLVYTWIDNEANIFIYVIDLKISYWLSPGNVTLTD